MSVDRTTSAPREDDTPPAPAGESTDRSAERTGSRQASPDDGRADQRAETRTREKYAGQVRADHSAGDHQGQAAETPRLTDADPPRQPETVTFENKDIEVTHNTADGVRASPPRLWRVQPVQGTARLMFI